MKVEYINYIVEAAKECVPPLLREYVGRFEVIHEGTLSLLSFSWAKVCEDLKSLPDPVRSDGSLDFMCHYSRLGGVVTIHVSPRSYGEKMERVLRAREKAIVDTGQLLLDLWRLEDKKAA